ncbi:hypothetical protein ABL78_1716 [Leptomonas seymouri]|uniref:Uncharacterized protein n=1 Tax=Leptomonas seymouri TaxID=5684 RepID=A0A0N1IM07_LEPSE|nr:hypothetical protein ABL78_1716 [Leptomonas seymouri]|eukprot:KPI89153.1 hypothetical protein ABL78_1716 [Leptomonas seymouri]
MLKHFATQRRGERVLSSASLAPLLRRRMSFITLCPTATPIATAPGSLLQQHRSISFTYATAVPCARFDVSTKDLARITSQPTLPPSANIYVIDLRKKHNKKKTNPRRIMLKMINAHRAEKKAAEEMDADDAYTPPLVFLVKTDDTTKQAARRQQLLNEQLEALGAFGEFRVCVLSAAKSRHWSAYVTSEGKGSASSAAAAKGAHADPPPNGDHLPPAHLSAEAGTVATSTENGSARGEAEKVAACSYAVEVDGERVDAEPRDGADGGEEEWEEIVEEVEEEEDEGGGGAADTQQQDAAMLERGVGAVTMEGDALPQRRTTKGKTQDDAIGSPPFADVAASSSPHVVGPPSPSPYRLSSSHEEAMGYDEEHLLGENAEASARFDPHHIHMPATLKEHSAVAEEEMKAGVDGFTEPPPSVQGTEVLEEFDIDGPLVANELTGAIANGPPSPHEPSPASTATPPAPPAATFAEAAPAVTQSSELYNELGGTGSLPSPPSEAAVSDKRVETSNVKSEEAAAGEAQADSTDSAEPERPLGSASVVPPAPPQPITPMPAYPDVSARLYSGASTTYLSDRALRELPLKANVLVIDRLDWDDSKMAAIDAALAQMDPVVGHVLLYRDAYAPQLECVVRENVVFRDALVPFIFVFRTNLTREVAQAQQRRFVEALRSRPSGLSVEQQALLAGRKDRTFVCVLCMEESINGGENPLEDPERRFQQAAPELSQQDGRAATESDVHEEEEEPYDSPVYKADVTADAEPERESSDALQRLWTMMDVSPVLPNPADAHKHDGDDHHSDDSGTGKETAEWSSKGQSSRPALTAAKKQFSVPVPTYEIEEEDLVAYGEGGSGSSAHSVGQGGSRNDAGGKSTSPSRRSRNARSAHASQRDLSSAPPTSLPPKPTPPPLSLGLLGFEKIVFGKPNSYTHTHSQYGYGVQEVGRSGGPNGSTHLAGTHSTGEMVYEVEDRQDSAHGAVDHCADETQAHEPHDGSSTSSATPPGVGACEPEMTAARKKGSRSCPSRRSRSGAARGQSRGRPKSKAAKKQGDAVASAAAKAQVLAEDAALEDFILSLYKDSDGDDAKAGKPKKTSAASRQNGGGASSVPSARSLIKSAGRRKKVG